LIEFYLPQFINGELIPYQKS